MTSLSCNNATHNAQNSKQEAEDGFALLYTFLIISLAVGLSSVILSSQTRQVRLTTTANQSTQAFYGSDFGYECALYQDRINENFDGSQSTPFSINCVSESATVSSTGCSGCDRAYAFSLDQNACADITVEKTDPTPSDPAKTVIRSAGYDDCDDKEVERVISTSYLETVLIYR